MADKLTRCDTQRQHDTIAKARKCREYLEKKNDKPYIIVTEVSKSRDVFLVQKVKGCDKSIGGYFDSGHCLNESSAWSCQSYLRKHGVESTVRMVEDRFWCDTYEVRVDF